MAKTAEKKKKSAVVKVKKDTSCELCNHCTGTQGECESYEAPFNEPMRKLNDGHCPTFTNQQYYI